VLKIWSTVKFFVVPYFVCQFIGSEHDSNSITLIITKHLLHRDCLHFTRVCGLCQLPSLSNAGNVSGYQLAGTVGFRDIETDKDFSYRKSEIFIEKIKIFMGKIKIFREKIIKKIIKKIIQKLPKSLQAGS